MRGKKSNPEFVSEFITKCIGLGITSPEAIVKMAKHDIEDIDRKIREVQSLKITRSNLLDVITTFDEPETKVEEAKLLPFFTLKYPAICKYLCDLLREEDGHIITDNLSANPDYIFCIKQMLECKIVSRYDQYIQRGERFDEYIKFVLREVE
jgi:hypothetical protein